MKRFLNRYLNRSWNDKNSYFYEPENADVKAAVDGAVLENNKEFLDEADRLGKLNAQWMSQGSMSTRNSLRVCENRGKAQICKEGGKTQIYVGKPAPEME